MCHADAGEFWGFKIIMIKKTLLTFSSDVFQPVECWELFIAALNTRFKPQPQGAEKGPVCVCVRVRVLADVYVRALG